NFGNCGHVLSKWGVQALHGTQRMDDYSNFPLCRSPDKAPVSPLIYPDGWFAIAYDCTIDT
ncbi:MAG: hypothetical protein ACN6NT_05395, partial [Comamonas sp.]